MANKRDQFTVFYGDPVQKDIPIESKDVFIQLINDGKAPSAALRSILKKYDLNRLDHSITFAFLKAAYPNIDLMDEGLSSRIIDADYPNNVENLSDNEFDEILERIKEGGNSW